YVQYQVATVYGFYTQHLFNITYLRAVQLVIKNSQLYALCPYIVTYLFQLALSYVSFIIGVWQFLYKGLYGLRPGGLCQEGQFVQVFLSLLFGLFGMRHTYQHSSLFFINNTFFLNHTSQIKSHPLARDGLLQNYV